MALALCSPASWARMLLLVSVIVAALTGVSAEWKTDRRTIYDNGCDFWGGDLPTIHTTSYERCVILCVNVIDCTHVTSLTART